MRKTQLTPVRSCVHKERPTGAAYHDFRRMINNKQQTYTELWDVLTFTDFLLAESIFNPKYKKYRQLKSIVTIREKHQSQ